MMHINTEQDLPEETVESKLIFTLYVSNAYPEIVDTIQDLTKDLEGVVIISEPAQDLNSLEKILAESDLFIGVDNQGDLITLAYELGFAQHAGIPTVLISSSIEEGLSTIQTNQRIKKSLTCLIVDEKGLIFNSFLTEAYELKKMSFEDMLHINKLQEALQAKSQSYKDAHARKEKELADIIAELKGENAILEDLAKEYLNKHTAKAQEMVKYNETL